MGDFGVLKNICFCFFFFGFLDRLNTVLGWLIRSHNLNVQAELERSRLDKKKNKAKRNNYRFTGVLC